MRQLLTKLGPYKTILLVFLAAEALLFLLLQWYTHSRIDAYLDDITHKRETKYQMILNAFDEKAQIAYATMIDTPQIKALFAKALHAPTPEEQDRLRRELYNKLLPKYNTLKRFGFKQIHFHTPDNRSFLRMHAPGRYGDDLSTFRKTVVYVNDSHQRISGFEEGIANDGYRFVFPLFSDDGYIGSVELSFSAYALSDFLKDAFFDTRFIISKKALVKPSATYVQSGIDSRFVVDRHYSDNSILLPDDSRIHRMLARQQESPFSLTAELSGRQYIETFIPVKNPVSKTTDAYMVILSQGKYLSEIRSNFFILFGALSVIVMLLMLRYIKERNFKQRIQQHNQQLERTNKKLKTILDAQENMIVITDGHRMAEVNARVLEFLGYRSFAQLRKHHRCICDFFIRHKEYFHLGRVPPQKDWIEYIATLPQDERVVTMIGIDMEAKAFQVNLAKYDENGSYIITFTDITEMLIRQRVLEYRAQHDRLTDIYNRQKIDEVLERICGYSSRRSEKAGVILFDIDHFKSVNDTYGHDVGDQVLKTLADYVRKNIREEDIFGRWGGEEFILILRHTTVEDTYKKAKMLKEGIATLHHPDIPSITASFGVTGLLPGDTTQSLLKRVDIALYKAKNEGRNRVILSSVTQKQLVLS